jgi:hypothetical protein
VTEEEKVSKSIAILSVVALALEIETIVTPWELV